MSFLRQLPRARSYVCHQCARRQRPSLDLVRNKSNSKSGKAQENAAEMAAAWKEKAARIRMGNQKSMLDTLEERGFIKDIAGGRDALDTLLTDKQIGAYVGVDPTAPSLHVGHLLPLMTLFWMYLHGYHTISLLGGSTVKIGDPSGRTTARSRQGSDVQSKNFQSMDTQLRKLWVHVKALGIKHKFSNSLTNRSVVLSNEMWLKELSAIDLMRDLGSGMRIGSMLARDSVKVRMESGEGMSFAEFSYPLFQGYDWWHMYSKRGVQLQIGGSDQYGNLCAGMEAVGHMRHLYHLPGDDDPLTATFGLSTPLMTTASGEKFGKSAGNAIWLDKDMLSSFDLYQYFLSTADDDVERYLRLFTFLPMEHIELVILQHGKDESKRTAQHLLAKEVVELAHGAEAAKNAALQHKEAFSQGTHIFSLTALRRVLSDMTNKEKVVHEDSQKAEEEREQLLTYKKEYAAQSKGQTGRNVKLDAVSLDASNAVTLPLSLLQEGSFPRVLYAAGLVSSKSEAFRLIESKGAYVVIPNSGSLDNPTHLKWEHIPATVKTVNPHQYLLDWEALVLRSGKSKIRICRIVPEEEFEEQGLTCPGWEEFKAYRRAPDE